MAKKPVDNGNIEIVEWTPEFDEGGEQRPRVCHLSKGEAESPTLLEAPPRYVSHFATCPNANMHRAIAKHHLERNHLMSDESNETTAAAPAEPTEATALETRVSNLEDRVGALEDKDGVTPQNDQLTPDQPGIEPIAPADPPIVPAPAPEAPLAAGAPEATVAGQAPAPEVETPAPDGSTAEATSTADGTAIPPASNTASSPAPDPDATPEPAADASEKPLYLVVSDDPSYTIPAGYVPTDLVTPDGKPLYHHTDDVAGEPGTGAVDGEVGIYADDVVPTA